MQKILISLLVLMSSSLFASSFGTYEKQDGELIQDLIKTCPTQAASLLDERTIIDSVEGEFVGGLTMKGVQTTYFFNFQLIKAGNRDVVKEMTVKAEELRDRKGKTSVKCSILEGKVTLR